MKTNTQAKSKRSKQKTDLILQYTGYPADRFPAEFRTILNREIEILRLPQLLTPMCPFDLVRPPAVYRDYIQTGFGDYFFDEVDYAIIEFRFGVRHPGQLRKLRLADSVRIIEGNMPDSELADYSWPRIRASLLRIIVESGDKPSNGEPTKPVVLTESQQKILKHLDRIDIALAQVDIAKEIGKSEKTTGTEIDGLKGMSFVSAPSGKKYFVGITQQGRDHLKSIEQGTS